MVSLILRHPLEYGSLWGDGMEFLRFTACGHVSSGQSDTLSSARLLRAAAW